MGFTFGGLHPDVWTERSLGGVRQIWNTLFVCRHCNEGVVVQFESTTPRGLSGATLINLHSDPRQDQFELVKVYPEAIENKAPEHTPTGIAQDFLEAVDSLRRKKFNSAAMMFRRVLERATLEIADDRESMEKKRLHKRIETLESLRKLTPAMKDLADVIRFGGNDAAHEDEVLMKSGRSRWDSSPSSSFRTLSRCRNVSGGLAARRTPNSPNDWFIGPLRAALLRPPDPTIPRSPRPHAASRPRSRRLMPRPRSRPQRARATPSLSSVFPFPPLTQRPLVSSSRPRPSRGNSSRRD